MKTTHALKIRSEYFQQVIRYEKNFEVRKADRDFKQGDRLLLEEIDDFGNYTGKMVERKIGYILDSPELCKEGYVVLGFKLSLKVIRCAMKESQGKNKKVKRYCRDCRYLSGEHSVRGFKCTCPDKPYYGTGSVWKNTNAYSCKYFKKKYTRKKENT